jgi:uncharacterized protein (TIGR02145 family)
MRIHRLLPLLLALAGPAGGQQPCPEAASVEFGGRTYNTVQIGPQCWLKENVNTGTLIGTGVQQTNNGVLEKYCNDFRETGCQKDGALFQWNEAMQHARAEGAQGVCPDGWRLPTKSDFEALLTAAGGHGNALLSRAVRGGTDSVGFSSLLPGMLDQRDNGWFRAQGMFAHYWSATESNDFFAYKLSLMGDRVLLTPELKQNALSVRCIKSP